VLEHLKAAQEVITRCLPLVPSHAQYIQQHCAAPAA
jgi:hypothetical protein